MKKIALFLFCIFMIACQNDEETTQLNNSNEISVSTRNDEKDCTQNFTGGNIWENLFGNPSSTMKDPDWKGTFEQQYYPCSQFYEVHDCCNSSVTKEFGPLELPFTTTCNRNLDATELHQLADVIDEIAMANRPLCEEMFLNPVAINVSVAVTSCCVYNQPPCLDGGMDACECMDEHPNNPYFECCRTYYLFVQVNYSRTTPCLSSIPEEFDDSM